MRVTSLIKRDLKKRNTYSIMIYLNTHRSVTGRVFFYVQLHVEDGADS